MKNITLLIIAISLYCFKIIGQNKFSDLALDKAGNKYLVGNFQNIIDLGNNNLLSSNSSTSIYIGKYDNKNICQWGTKISGKNTENNINAIFVEPNGNFYITGYFISEANFGGVKVKSSINKTFSSITLFIAKYNTSGDPIWIKKSENKGSDNGNAIASDNKGNIYVLGTFDNNLVYDGKTATSSGKNDICVIKINNTGNCEWIKNYGTKEDEEANTILFANNKLIIGGNSQLETSGYVGFLAEISTETGAINWQQNIGTSKGNIERIAIDNLKNYIITGSIESSSSNKDGCELFVKKINANTGLDIWIKKFHSNQARGKDIVCDESGNLFITGSFMDSLHLDGFYLSGLEYDDIFLAKMTPNGKVSWAKSFGHNKNDIGTKLILKNNEIILAGEFTNGIELGTTFLSGGTNTIFSTTFDIQKSTFSNSAVLAREESKNLPNSKYSDIKGKLLIGSDNDKSYLNDQAILIEDVSGNVIKRTITDENGDFSFKNVDVAETLNLILEKNDKLKETDQVYLAQQNGIILNKLELDKNNIFHFKLLPITMTKLEPLEEEKEPIIAMKDFKISKEVEIILTERILYEPGSYSLPAESVNNINQIALFLRQNPKMKLEIFSHTDANGDDNSNLILSEKRANEVKTYLMKKQISPDRIIIKGLGETQIINRCANNVKCTAVEHAYNRRTEFKFIKGIGL